MAKRTQGSSFALREMMDKVRHSSEGVQKNLTGTIKDVKTAALRGLLQGVVIVRRDMDESQPFIPVRNNNMRSGFFVVTYLGEIREGAKPTFNNLAKDAAKLLQSQTQSLVFAIGKAKEMSEDGKKVVVIIGFGAYYASIVHEMIAGPGSAWPTTIQWTRPGSGPKFLQAAMRKNDAKVKAVVAASIKAALS